MIKFVAMVTPEDLKANAGKSRIFYSKKREILNNIYIKKEFLLNKSTYKKSIYKKRAYIKEVYKRIYINHVSIRVF